MKHIHPLMATCTLLWMVHGSIPSLQAALPSAPLLAQESSQQAESAKIDVSKVDLPRVDLPWTATFDEAVAQSKKEKKPIFIYFSGSDWCSWCMKMESEILSTPEFQKAISDKFVFYRADFPIYKTQDSAISSANEKLKMKYNIAGFPTIVLVDPDLHEFAKLNYRQDSGKGYAEYVLKQLGEQ
ncbi:MAG TPA: thioredoxin family protein, partial [Chlamydiales bacterium]|nr:thioredoxin family protein [Chlamydiales bacterium]